jgi:hypothetical protein
VNGIGALIASFEHPNLVQGGGGGSVRSIHMAKKMLAMRPNTT